jgi:hypothetical protein
MRGEANTCNIGHSDNSRTSRRRAVKAQQAIRKSVRLRLEITSTPQY